MKRHFAQTKAQKQADWMHRFDDALVTRHPKLSGRIEWEAAKYYYLHGFTVEDAVERYCIARDLA